MPLYDEATQPGSSFPSRLSLPPDHGSIIPHVDFLGVVPRGAGFSPRARAGSFTPPPRTAGVPSPARVAEIIKPFPVIGESLAGTVYNATPVSNVTSVLSDIPHAARRPLIPPGLRQRAAENLPPGIRQRATVWARAVARWRSSRPTSGGKISRE